MKLKVNTAVRQKAREDSLDDIDIPSAVAKLKAAMGDVDAMFVSRTEEVSIITHAIVAGQHVLLEGNHGVAKSDLAREAFKRITGANVYDKMFSKGTLPDDVFGPTMMESYRAGRYEHNTEGALPEAHFANLEELGRASDLLLPSCMTVLNERLFHNGNKVVQCPLVTAIATTNFMNDNNKELAAFIDRWLARVQVQPLSSVQKQEEMIWKSLAPRPAVSNTVSLREILAINRALMKIQPEPETVRLYVELVASYVREAGVAYLSDRRRVHAFRLARAAALLSDSPSVSPDHLNVVKYGIMQTGKDDEQKFNTVMQRLVGQIQKSKQEKDEIMKAEKYLKVMYERYDPQLNDKELRDLYESVKKVRGGFANRSEPFTIPECQQRFSDVVSKIDSLFKEIQTELSRR